jgi:hypothetical protein
LTIINATSPVAGNNTADDDPAKLERPMAVALHLVPDDSFDDWVVRGRELGHYPTRETAELFAHDIVRKSGAEIIVHLPDGRPDCTRLE